VIEGGTHTAAHAVSQAALRADVAEQTRNRTSAEALFTSSTRKRQPSLRCASSHHVESILCHHVLSKETAFGLEFFFASVQQHPLEARPGLRRGRRCGYRFDHDGLVRIVIGTKSSTTIEAIQALYEKSTASRRTRSATTKSAAPRIPSSIPSFQFRLARESPARTDGLRLLRLPCRLPGTLPRRHRKSHAGGRSPCRRQVPAQRSACRAGLGNLAEFDKPLSSMGTVANVDITIPEPGADRNGDKNGSEPAKPAASNPEAAHWQPKSPPPSAALKSSSPFTRSSPPSPSRKRLRKAT